MFDNGEAVPHHCLTVPKGRHLAGRRGEFVPLTAFVPILIIKGNDSLFEQQSRLLACQPTAQGPTCVSLVPDEELHVVISRQPSCPPTREWRGWARGLLPIPARRYPLHGVPDRTSTRLNSSHSCASSM